MVDALSKRSDIHKYSKVVDFDELIKNDFNLSVSKYVDTFEGKFVSLRNLKQEKYEIDKKCKKLDYQIDAMMRELNIRY